MSASFILCSQTWMHFYEWCSSLFHSELQIIKTVSNYENLINSPPCPARLGTQSLLTLLIFANFVSWFFFLVPTGIFIMSSKLSTMQSHWHKGEVGPFRICIVRFRSSIYTVSGPYTIYVISIQCSLALIGRIVKLNYFSFQVHLNLLEAALRRAGPKSVWLGQEMSERSCQKYFHKLIKFQHNVKPQNIPLEFFW